MRPLDPLKSIKAKLGIVIVAAVAVTLIVHYMGPKAGLPEWVTAIAAFVLALAMVQFLARGMTSPLREMAAAASAMAKGDYSRRVRATSRDEVGQLASAFNQMAADLHEVDRMRRDLVANVSHELRTPITALQAVLENLVDGIGPPDRTTLETMLIQVHRLARLVDQLLDLSKLESGALPLRIGDFEVRPMLDQAIREARVHAAGRLDRRVRFDLEAHPDDLVGRGDVERIHQVVGNLIDNAVLHSPESGTVRVSAARDDGYLVIEVADEGPGIPPSEREKVFERFYRADGSRSTDSGGSGLGLAIARWIVDLHGGEIVVADNAPRGCRMSVRLPDGAA